MAKRVLTIEAGVTKTRICEIDYVPLKDKGFNTKKQGRKLTKVYNTLVIDTPENAIDDGYVRDKEAFSTVLKKAIEDGGFKTTSVIFVLTSSRIASREIEIPKVKPDKIDAIISANASDYFPVDISEYSIAYAFTGMVETEEAEKYKMMVYAAPNNLIHNINAFAEMMRLEVVSLDYVGNSVYQSLKRQITDPLSFSVQINEQNSIVSIIEEDRLVMQRVVNTGYLQLVGSVLEYAEELGLEDEKDAVRYLQKHTMINVEFDSPMPLKSEEMTDEQYEKLFLDYQIRENVTESLHFLVNNILRMLDYYRSKNDGTRITICYLSGDAAWYQGISHLLKHELEFESVKKMENLATFQFVDKWIMEDRQSDYIVCVGASLAPVGFKEKSQDQNDKNQVSLKGPLMVLGVSVLASALMVGFVTVKNRLLLKEQGELNEQLASIQNVDAVFAEHDAAVLVSSQLDTLYSYTVSNTERLNELIAELERLLPSQMVVNSLSVSETDFNMSLTSRTKISVAKMITLFESSDMIGSATVSGLSESKNEAGVTTVSFSVSCTYADQAPQEVTE